MLDIQRTVLICPKNDEESLQILKIAKALGLPTIVSKQPHGAKLDREKYLTDRILKLNPHTEAVVIVEIPGEEAEKKLFADGFDVRIIDHHIYEGIDRMSDKSSLEQFRDLFKIDDSKVKSLGFDPKMLDAVAAMDRGFIWELIELGWGETERIEALEYYKMLTKELGSRRRKKEEAAAKKAWKHYRVERGVLIIESTEDKVSIRDAISFLIAQNFGEPKEAIIRQGRRRIYVQDTDKAEELMQEFGGFTFGKNRCWGLLNEAGDLPTVDEILRIIAK